MGYLIRLILKAFVLVAMGGLELPLPAL